MSLAGPEAAAKIFGRRCSQYLHAWYVSEEEKATKESEDSKHWYCRNCFHGRLPVGQTVESLYELRRAGPRVFPGEYQHSPPQRKPQFFLSEAKEHDPAQPLWHIEQRFGDHSDGLAVMELDSPLEEEGKRFSINQSWGITFFFQGEVLKVPPHFKTLANGARSRVKEKERTRAQKHKHEQVSRAVQAQNILLGLLPEPPEDT